MRGPDERTLALGADREPTGALVRIGGVARVDAMSLALDAGFHELIKVVRYLVR